MDDASLAGTPPDDARAPEAFARQFEEVGPVLLAWARLRVRPELRTQLDPEDLLQEVGCRAFANVRAFDAQRGSFRQWVFGIANRVLLEAMRELGRQPRVVEPGPERTGFSDVAAVITSITRKVARDELVGRFLLQVDGLEHGDRELLLHHGLEELTHAQVAALLGIGEDAVRKRWQRLRDRLREDPAFGMLALGA